MSTLGDALDALSIQTDTRDVPLFIEVDGALREYGGFTVWINEQGQPYGVVIFGQGQNIQED